MQICHLWCLPRKYKKAPYVSVADCLHPILWKNAVFFLPGTYTRIVDLSFLWWKRRWERHGTVQTDQKTMGKNLLHGFLWKKSPVCCFRRTNTHHFTLKRGKKKLKVIWTSGWTSWKRLSFKSIRCVAPPPCHPSCEKWGLTFWEYYLMGLTKKMTSFLPCHPPQTKYGLIKGLWRDHDGSWAI